jgi:hypothetical protein
MRILFQILCAFVILMVVAAKEKCTTSTGCKGCTLRDDILNSICSDSLRPEDKANMLEQAGFNEKNCGIWLKVTCEERNGGAKEL